MTVRRLLHEIPARELDEWAVMGKIWDEQAHEPPKTIDEQLADLLAKKASAALDARGT